MGHNSWQAGLVLSAKMVMVRPSSTDKQQTKQVTFGE